MLLLEVGWARWTRSGEHLSERWVNTKNDDTSNPGFLSVPHKSFVKLDVIPFLSNIGFLFTVDFCINLVVDTAVFDSTYCSDIFRYNLSKLVSNGEGQLC